MHKVDARPPPPTKPVESHSRLQKPNDTSAVSTPRKTGPSSAKRSDSLKKLSQSVESVNGSSASIGVKENAAKREVRRLEKGNDVLHSFQNNSTATTNSSSLRGNLPTIRPENILPKFQNGSLGYSSGQSKASPSQKSACDDRPQPNKSESSILQPKNNDPSKTAGANSESNYSASTNSSGRKPSIFSSLKINTLGRGSASPHSAQSTHTNIEASRRSASPQRSLKGAILGRISPRSNTVEDSKKDDQLSSSIDTPQQSFSQDQTLSGNFFLMKSDSQFSSSYFSRTQEVDKKKGPATKDRPDASSEVLQNDLSGESKRNTRISLALRRESLHIELEGILRMSVTKRSSSLKVQNSYVLAKSYTFSVFYGQATVDA
ncbi:hypothetical protein HDU83_003640 [Entophlyctis luteolus]|nr:hypothetical protein HDU83_003640 [Entophlyctis luteolus]